MCCCRRRFSCPPSSASGTVEKKNQEMVDRLRLPGIISSGLSQTSSRLTDCFIAAVIGAFESSGEKKKIGKNGSKKKKLKIQIGYP
jgi:hypothetical protein